MIAILALSAATTVGGCALSLAPDDGVASDAAAGDAVSLADGARAAEGGTGTDGALCADFSGAFDNIVVRCTRPGVYPVLGACVAQRGCGGTLGIYGNSSDITVRGGTLHADIVLGTGPPPRRTTRMTCTAVLSDGDHLAMHCVEAADAASTCDMTGTRVTIPNATSYCCDVHTQDCAPGERCVAAGVTDSFGEYVPACVPAGTLSEGTNCSPGASNRLGDDACGAGLECLRTVPGQSLPRACLRLCTDTLDCAAGEACVAVGATRPMGYCQGTCTLGGMACPAGEACGDVLAFRRSDAALLSFDVEEVCGAANTGAAREGAPCAGPSDCAAGLVCDGGGSQRTCRVPCDQSRACPTNERCRLYSSEFLYPATNPDGIGACEAM